MTQTQNSPKLVEIIEQLLFGDEKFTDLMFESGQPVMMRRAQREWVKVIKDGAPTVATHDALLELVHASLEDGKPLPSSQSPKPKWLEELFQRGSLHYAKWFGTGDKSVRVRCTVQLQLMRQTLGLVMRPLVAVPESLVSLGLPPSVGAMLQSATSGLVVVTGPTGSGKSTTLAAMVNEINETRTANILTLEDPIEFEHERKKSVVNQRELELDVASFHQGVKDALRFVPDVILIGEIRDAETMRAALRAGESGHLVLTSMHAPSSVAAIKKMLGYLSDSPGDLQSLAGCLVGVVAQALVRDTGDDGGRVLVYEYLDVQEDQRLVSNAILSSDSGRSELAAVEEKLRSRGLGRSIPMIKCALELIETKKVDPLRVAGVLSHPDDRRTVLSMARTDPRPGLKRVG